MKALLLPLFLLAHCPLFAQDFRMHCGRQRQGYEHGGKDNFSMVVLCPYYEYTNTKAIPADIVNKNSNYLRNRVGSAFYNKLTLEYCLVTDFSNKNLVPNEKWLDVADKRVKYAFRYYFKVQKGVRYYLTTVYDSLGNMISPHMLPDQRYNKDFRDIISLCQARHVAETDARYQGSAKNISLEYADSVNAFVWAVTLTEVPTDIPRITKQHVLMFHANSGAFLKREEHTLYSVCDGNTPPFPVLKPVPDKKRP